MLQIDVVAERAELADGAAPLDEAMWMAVRDGSAHVINRDGCFGVVRGDEMALVVDPPIRGHGLGRALVQKVLAEHPDVRRAWSHGNHPAAAALAAQFGWERVRDLWVMRRSLDPDSSDLPGLVVPDDLALHRFGEGANDSAELLRVNAAAFADHPEQGAMDVSNLSARMAEPWFDPRGLILATATEGGPVLGFHWTKVRSPELGEVYVVGVDPAAQGRGIGRLVTLAGLHHLAAVGVREVLLYVEADNTAAIATYSALGFTHAEADTHVMYVRP